MSIPKLWSKLENVNDITSPQLGTGGSVIGSPTYVASKFNNGILSDVNSEGCKFSTFDNNINLNKGTIEFWAKMKFASEDADYRCLWDFLNTSYGGIYLYYISTVDYFTVAVFSGGSQVLAINTPGMSWSVDDLIHFAVTWDREGNDIGSSKTIALYIDNVEKVSSTTTWSADTVEAILAVGVRSSEVSWHSDVVIDNIKTYDTCKIDFSDRNTEKPPYSAPITNSDIKWYHSVNWEEGDNHGGDINLSSEIISDELGNIFDDVADEERIMGTTEYRKVYIYLDKEVILFNLKLWIDQSALSPDDEISICVGGVTNEDTQEDAENYEYINPANFGEATVLGDLTYLDYFPIWIRRIVSPYAVPWHHSTFKLRVGF